MIDSSFYNWLVSFLPSGWEAQEGKLDFDRRNPFIWFRRASTMQERLLSGVPLNSFTTDFDVELVGSDIDEVQSQTDELKTALINISPCSLLGDTFCLSIDVLEHSDDYIPKTVFESDTGLHVSTFQIKIMHRA